MLEPRATGIATSSLTRPDNDDALEAARSAEIPINDAMGREMVARSSAPSSATTALAARGSAARSAELSFSIPRTEEVPSATMMRSDRSGELLKHAPRRWHADLFAT